MALLLVGCAKEYDYSALENRVTTLETNLDNLRAQMTAVQAVALGQYVQKVEQTAEGVTVTYGDGSVVTLKISAGGSGAGVLSVVKNSNGDLCWAVDGTILTYEGKDLVVGTVSNIYVEGGKLYAVIGGEAKELGGFSGGATLEDGIFKNIQVTDEGVVLTLSDDSTITIPLASAFRLVIPKTTYSIASTDPFDVAYTLNGGIEGTVVDIFTDGNFEGVVEADKFVITPKAVVKGSALAYADSQVGLTSIVKLTFDPDATVEEDYSRLTDTPVSEEYDYLAEAAEGTVDVHIVSNASVDVRSEADWITVQNVKATNYTITLAVAANPTEEIRTGEVKVYAAGTENVLQTIKVAQKAKEEEPVEMEYYNPAGWEKVFNMSDYKTNSTFMLGSGLDLNPSNVTLQWKFYSNKWNNHKFNDRDANGNQLFSNRLGEFANSDESKSVLLRFSNDGDADGQLCLNASALGLNQEQLKKDGQPYVWPTGEWVVFTLVADGTNLTIYDDDEVVTTLPYTPAASWNFARFDLSMTWDEGGANWPLKQAFNGYTAYTRVWSRALSKEEIAAGLCEVPASGREGLEIEWKFDGSTDKWIENTAGKNDDIDLDFTSCFDGNNNAKDNGDAAAAAWTTLEGSDVDGICSRVAGSEPVTPVDPDPQPTTIKALSFAKEGAQNWYVFQNDIDLSNGYTYIIHFLPTKVDGLWPIMMKMSAKATQSNPTCHRFMNSQDRTGASDFAHIAVSWNNGTSVHIPAKDVTLEANKWYSLAWTNDATNGPRLYMDGVLVNSGNADADAISKMLFGAIEFGDSWGDDGFTPKPYPGCLAMMSVWDKALSAEEVAALVKKAPANLNDEHLKAYWPMNEGEGGILKEATGKYESIDFHYGWSDRYGGKYGTGEDLDNTEYLEWIEVPAM